eukprot:1623946-Karenia_brevis.AAC.1
MCNTNVTLTDGWHCEGPQKGSKQHLPALALALAFKTALVFALAFAKHVTTSTSTATTATVAWPSARWVKDASHIHVATF